MRSPRRLAIGLLAVAAALTLLSLLGAFLRWPPAGLVLETVTRCGRAPERQPTGAASRVEPKALTPDAIASGCAQARWSGFWAVTGDRAINVKAVVDGHLRLDVDGQSVLDTGAADAQLKHKVLGHVEPGLRSVAVEWTPAETARSAELRVAWRRAAGAWRDLDEALLFPTRPSAVAVLARRVRPALRWLTFIAWLLTASVWLVRLRSRVGPHARSLAQQGQHVARLMGSGWRPRVLAGTALAAVLLYGATLRLEALVIGYWPDDAPQWTQRVVSLIAPWRPATFRWSRRDDPYAGGDPSAYLRYARQMRNPYEARVREPAFVMATKLGLWLTRDRAVGVSVAAGIFSVLAIAVTYLLGAYAFSRWVGLGAALALAIERNAVAHGVAGYRDEAFAVFVVLTAWAALRLYRRGTFCDALLLGLAGGAAWLTRITTPTLLLPLYVTLGVFPRSRPWRRRLEHAAVAALVSAALIAPFMINCAAVYGDPFYSINEHVVFYRAGSNLAYAPGMTVLDYLRSSFRPAQMADTLFVGYTEYAFGRKWSYDDWAPWLAPAFATLAVAGLALWLLIPGGRLLLLVHAATMLAFAFTYEAHEGGPWRLTFHAYPFYLLAACLVLVGALRLCVSPAARQALLAWLTLGRGLALAAGAAGLVLAGLLLWHGLYYLRFAESVRAGGAAQVLPSVSAGRRDAFFFTENWHRAVAAPNWPGHFLRYPRGRSATLRLPLAAGQPCTVVLGLDPIVAVPDQARTVDVDLNGRHLKTLTLTWHAHRMGRYAIGIPGSAVVRGGNRLTLTADRAVRADEVAPEQRAQLPRGWETAFELRYVLVRSAGRPVAPTPASPPLGSYAPAPPSPSPTSARRAP